MKYYITIMVVKPKYKCSTCGEPKSINLVKLGSGKDKCRYVLCDGCLANFVDEFKKEMES